MWAWELEPLPEEEPVGEPGGTRDPRSGDDDGSLVVPDFDARADAETWIGEHWRDLSARGVRRAQLVDDGTPVGEPLPLPEVVDERAG